MDAAIGHRMRRDRTPDKDLTPGELRYLYVVESGAAVVKVGFTANLTQRLNSMQASSPHELRLHHAVPVARSQAALIEKRAIELLSPRRMRGEWFAVHPATAYEAITRAVREIEGQAS